MDESVYKTNCLAIHIISKATSNGSQEDNNNDNNPEVKNTSEKEPNLQ